MDKTHEQIVLDLLRSTQIYVAKHIQDEHHRICYNGAINGIYNELKNISFLEMRQKLDDLSKNMAAFSPNVRGSKFIRWKRYLAHERRYIEMAFEHVRDIFQSIDRRFITGYYSNYVAGLTDYLPKIHPRFTE